MTSLAFDGLTLRDAEGPSTDAPATRFLWDTDDSLSHIRHSPLEPVKSTVVDLARGRPAIDGGATTV